jgi:hypothetical protein
MWEATPPITTAAVSNATRKSQYTATAVTSAVFASVASPRTCTSQSGVRYISRAMSAPPLASVASSAGCRLSGGRL